MTSYDHGVPCWIDIGVADFDRAAAFYRDLFGWEVPDGDEALGGYRSARLDGRLVAGMSPMQTVPGTPFWTTFVHVDDADAVLATVADAGGQVVVEPMDVMDLGRTGILADPTGASIGVWEPGTHHGAEVTNVAGAYSWSELLTSDVDAAIAFYATVLGWEARTSSGPMPYTELRVGGRSVAGMLPRPPAMPSEVPDHWGVYFAVDDLAASVARASELGGTVLAGTIETPAGPVAPITDPTGAASNLIQLVERHRS